MQLTPAVGNQVSRLFNVTGLSAPLLPVIELFPSFVIHLALFIEMDLFDLSYFFVHSFIRVLFSLKTKLS